MAKPLRICVLDDHVDVAESLGEILELRGHEVTLVHNGSDAIKAYADADFDIGFFDVKMPGINGVESFLEIVRAKPASRIVMMSGFADDGLIAKALAGGALGLLRKPFDGEDLLKTLDDVIEGGVVGCGGGGLSPPGGASDPGYKEAPALA
jgi:two-component system, NtrC family, response regulator HydG